MKCRRWNVIDNQIWIQNRQNSIWCNAVRLTKVFELGAKVDEFPKTSARLSWHFFNNNIGRGRKLQPCCQIDSKVGKQCEIILKTIITLRQQKIR